MAWIDGFYAAYMTGETGQGFGLFVFQDGVIVGADPLGVKFDGSYETSESTESVSVLIQVDVPPNGTVIQGASSGPSGMRYAVRVVLQENSLNEDWIRIQTPIGPVNLRLKKIRNLN